MRLIGIGLLAFLLAGVALSLSNSQSLRFTARLMTEKVLGPRLAFETSTDTQAEGVDSKAVVRCTQISTPIILTGLPAYQSTTFYLPIDARPSSGYLQIDTTMQILSGVEGVLRVSIGNKKRAELLLRPGETSRSFRVALTMDDLAREQLRVSFSLQGDGQHYQCDQEAGLEAIVEIETSSAVHLTLESGLSSLRDRVMVNGRTVQLALPSDNQSAVLFAAHKLAASGLDFAFSGDDVDPTTAAYLADELKPIIETPSFAWSEATRPNSDLYEMRRFRDDQTWRIVYDFTEAASRILPAQFDLEMVLGRQEDDAPWLVSVALNGKLVVQVQAQSGAYFQSIALPAGFHRLVNALEITATTFENSTDECTQTPKVVAEIRSSSTFRSGNAVIDDPFLNVIDALSDGWALSAEGLSAPEAHVAAELIAHLPLPVDGTTPVYVQPRGASLAAWQASKGEVWVVSYDDEHEILAKDLSEYRSRFARDVLLIVDLRDQSW